VKTVGRKEYENVERSTGPNSAKYHSRSANWKKQHEKEEQNRKDKFKDSTI
jgi:hypothetical protein